MAAPRLAHLAPLMLLAGCASGTQLGRHPTAPVHDPAGLLSQPSSLAQAAARAVSAQRLSAWHELVASEPHRAGTVGDEHQVQHLAQAFSVMGLQVERHPFWAWLPRPVSASLSITSPVELALATREPPLESDPFTQHPGLDIGFNAYSASGVAAGQVVYANHGRKQDFERLEELGVSCRGRIVLARYGGNFRGYKAKFAEQAGATGLIIFTDPADAGWGKGLSWPEGGWARAGSIQRGSILTVPWAGDPLTPGREATEHAERLDPAEVGLPAIPVQPVSWSAAEQILERMTGQGVPDDWQGGLPFRYRLEGGPELNVRLEVEQRGELVRSENVLGTLRGSEHPEQLVVVGCHHDAWADGATDPTAGLIAVLEAARAFATAAEEGLAPRRSIVFAAWGAEEYGLVGSTEWVESRPGQVSEQVVAYLNLDAAVKGPHFSASASPALQDVIAAAAAEVDTVPGSEQATVLDDWIGRGTQPDAPWLPALGDLGGGSDFVAFLARGGVPSAGLSSSGAKGTAYHSIDDTLTWYRAIVGDDYKPARMLTQVLVGAAARLADAPLVPLDPARLGAETLRHLRNVSAMAKEAGMLADGGGTRPTRAAAGQGAEPGQTSSEAGDALAGVAPELAGVARAALDDARRCASVLASLAAAEHDGRLGDQARQSANTLLMALPRAFLDEQGLPDRPWYRNLFAAPDEDSGYASYMLPGLRAAVARNDAAMLAHEAERLVAVFGRRTDLLDQLDALAR